ncbi:hypothetical protein [Streptomyces sp. NPDC001268]|uniref:hypothetical protein n=1 Tax=Streptomyces sp. NPDC001268 TaxID=3364553 RepID=UPI003682241A
MTASDLARMDVPLPVVAAEIAALADKRRQQQAAELEQQIAELREHAVQHLAERGTEPTPEHWAQWHEFLDIDPDLRGRDYTTGGTA